MKRIFVDDNMSNLTSASNEASLSSSSNRNEIGSTTMYPPPQPAFASSVPNNQTQSSKKKRNLPGNPDPEAEVIAMSPRSLMATNRFICEICNKGFQRDQNLQLHRRGHNLPWKLKQRAKQELIRKKVYVCPEASCIHHDPARALGDLTGIKKHFFRKHGEKKWKCEKCSKRYAVQSDWKAHSKICGTREYRCDCGTLFSRRDSFITHRAFCDALAEESARPSSSAPLIIPPNQNPNHHHHHLPLQFPPILFPPLLKTEAVQADPEQYHNLPFNLMMNNNGSRQHDQLLPHPQNSIPPWLDHQNPNPNANIIPTVLAHAASSAAHMSATALLQKAAQMGVTMSKPTCTSAAPSQPSILLGTHQAHMPTSIPTAGLSSSEEMGMISSSGFDNVSSGCMEQVGAATPPPPHFDHMGSAFEETFDINGMLNSKRESMVKNFQEPGSKRHKEVGSGGGGGGGISGHDELTRDFLGIRGFDHRDHFLNMGGFEQISNSASYHDQQQNQNHAPWQG